MKIQKPSFKTCSPRVESRKGAVLILDVGTTGIKAFVFDGKCQVLTKSYRKISKIRPRRGWVEQDPKEILRVSISVLRQTLKDSGVSPSAIQGMGITNQREATVLWDRRTGKPVYPIIGWEDSRSRHYCRSFSKQDQKYVRQATGLPIDSYFSATKIHWIFQNFPEMSKLAEAGRLAFGTIDSWLLWNLCEDRPHRTDETNAARTLLFNIRTRRWDEKLLNLFGVPPSVLPSVFPSRSSFGTLDKGVVGTRVPVLAVCGDQQASTYAAIRSGRSSSKTIKVTYGTGVFLAQVIGKSFRLRQPFLTTLTPDTIGTSFALEGKLEGSGEAVNLLLKNPTGLHAYLKKLSVRVDGLIRQLPVQPIGIVIDGGGERDGIIVTLQEQSSGIPACLQATYDGTALGTALLVSDVVKKSVNSSNSSRAGLC